MTDDIEDRPQQSGFGFVHLLAIVIAVLTCYKMGEDGWRRSGWGGMLLYGGTGLVLAPLVLIVALTVLTYLLGGLVAMGLYLYASPESSGEGEGEPARRTPLRGRIVSGLIIAAILTYWGFAGPDLIRSVGSKEQYQDALLMGIYFPACVIALASLPWTMPILQRRSKSVGVGGTEGGANSGGMVGGSPTLQDEISIP